MIYKGINFNGSSYTGGECKLWCNFDNSAGAKLFLSERHVVCLEYSGAGDPYIGPDIETRIATYSRDENNRVIIDLTDWIRTHYKDRVLTDPRIGVYTEDDDIFSLFESVGDVFLRNPNTFPIPPSLSDVLCIMPPSRMLATDVRDGISGRGFLWGKKGQPSVRYKYRQKGETEWTYIADGEEFWIGTSMYHEGVEIDDGVNVFTLEPAKAECGVRYAMIFWRSLAGPYKMHHFVVKSQKTETQGDYSLLMVDNSYNVIKGSEESLILSIDELNTYDLWYYSDILTSSEVKLQAIDGEMLTGSEIRLEITTKSVTVPSGDRADGKLEFEAKIKRYDAVTL